MFDGAFCADGGAIGLEVFSVKAYGPFSRPLVRMAGKESEEQWLWT
jgi:hypothetical protein